jgi:hypothetical protein
MFLKAKEFRGILIPLEELWKNETVPLQEASNYQVRTHFSPVD